MQQESVESAYFCLDSKQIVQQQQFDIEAHQATSPSPSALAAAIGAIVIGNATAVATQKNALQSVYFASVNASKNKGPVTNEQLQPSQCYTRVNKNTKCFQSTKHAAVATVQGSCKKPPPPAGVDQSIDAEDIKIIEKMGYTPLRFMHYGPFSRIYDVKNGKGMEFIAKVESKHEPKKTLGLEARVYQDCQHARGFPTLFGSADVAGNRVLVIQKLGTDLSRIRRTLQGFTKVDAIKLCLKTFCRIWTLHEGGWLHRDIKPSNFVIGMPPGDDQIYIVDFGLSRPISEHVRPAGNCPNVGTTAYKPLAAHNRAEYQAKEDLESWFYMCVQLITGTLPWINVPKELMADFKLYCRASGRYLLTDGLPPQFDKIFDIIQTATPLIDYFKISALLKSACAELGDEKLAEPYAWMRDPSIVERALLLDSEN